MWDEILVTADGLGAAMWEKCTQPQGFGMFGPGRGYPPRPLPPLWSG